MKQIKLLVVKIIYRLNTKVFLHFFFCPYVFKGPFFLSVINIQKLKKKNQKLVLGKKNRGSGGDPGGGEGEGGSNERT